MSTEGRRVVAALVACLVAAASASVFARWDSDDEKTDRAKRPKLVLTLDLTVGMAPARVTLRADLVGGADDYQDFYCPSIEWNWGDGTKSESTFDCQPYHPGVSEIVRHFAVEHVFQEGQYHVTFRLKRADKELAAARANVSIR
jgi:hypothetical protein